MLSPKTKRNLLRIIPFGIIWFVNALVFFFIEIAALGDFENPPSAIDLSVDVAIFGLIAVIFVGLLVGAVEIFFVNKLLSKFSFTKKIIYKVIIYSFIILLVTVALFPIAASLEMNTSVFDKRVWNKLLLFLTSITHASTYLQSGVSVFLSIFYSEISENIGHGILRNFFTGKYHKPTVEKRIFMFTDMKSSTSIAEKLGHTEYFNLLKEYYNDLSDAIIQYSGEVYQYVGDEIVVSWEYEKGIRNNNCLKCFFAMKNDLKKKSGSYIEYYGVAPSFKAGLHFGNVTTGEIGALKKEIIFTGDVLNTSSRIQGLCNKFDVDLLISEELINNLSLESNYEVKSFGESELKGKVENIKLSTVVPKPISETNNEN